jgi:hypothetical protein
MLENLAFLAPGVAILFAMLIIIIFYELKGEEE